MKNVIELLEKRISINPNGIFVDDGEREISFSDAAKSARIIGSKLCADGNGMVCILAEKNIKSFLFLLGAVYAGRPYVFINSTSPEERILAMLDVADSDTLYVDRANEDVDYLNGITKVYMDYYFECKNTNEIVLQNVMDRISEDDILYGMFTSGTTGTPKLVIASHKGVIEFIEDFVNTTELTEDSVIANQAPFDFDVSVKDIYSALYTGCKLVLIRKELLTKADMLLSFLNEKKVDTLIWAVTALCLASNVDDFGSKVPLKIKKVMFSGEVMPMSYFRKWKKALPEAEFINLYGPTEVICNCTYYKIKNGDENLEKLPIGIPFSRRKIYLIDENGKIINRSNKTGELCAGGGTLATGYMHNSVETKKRFTILELSDGKTDFVYRTGDMAYYDESGILYFDGRKDFQIKRMGHRIELEEIDSKLMKIDGVELSCTLYEEKTQKMCSFYCGEAKQESIRRLLRDKIPRYMLPNRIIPLRNMPVNKNGKIDRERLKTDYAGYFR